MRVLQFCTNFWKGGGIQTHVTELGAWLRSRGHEVVYAGDPVNSIVDPQGLDFIPLDMRKVSRPDGNILFRVVALLQSALKLRKAILSHPVELIHTHETGPALVARLATFGMKIPLIMTFHGSAPERIPQAAKIAKFSTDLTASPSRISLDALIEEGVDPDKSSVLGLGIKPLPTIRDEEVSNLRQSYMKSTEGTLIFSPSRLAPQKGIDIMIEVAKRVTEKHPDVVFVVAGGGVLSDQVNQWAEQAGVAENMHFIGPIDTVPAHLKAADLFLLTSRWEALPISIVEAFRAGLPVIATDCGGVSELVDDSVGALCQVEDVEGLTKAVLDFVESEELRRTKGAAALERSREDRFDVEAVHKKFEATYQELLGENAR